MESIYIFSSKNFYVTHQNKEYILNKNSILKITDFNYYDFIIIYDKLSNQELKLYPHCKNSTNYYNVYTLGQDKYIEIIASNYSNLLCKLCKKNTEVYVFENAIRLIDNEQCFCSSFEGNSKSHLIASDNKILIFNENCFLEFDKENKIFNKLNIEKYVKNNKKIEILCKIPHNLNYFLYFNINLENNSYSCEKYKNTQPLGLKQNNDNKNIIFSFFYLAKYNFEDGKTFLLNEEIFENCNKYFSSFKTLLLCNNNYYGVASKALQQITFTLDGNKIIDMD